MQERYGGAINAIFGLEQTSELVGLKNHEILYFAQLGLVHPEEKVKKVRTVKVFTTNNLAILKLAQVMLELGFKPRRIVEVLREAHLDDNDRPIDQEKTEEETAVLPIPVERLTSRELKTFLYRYNDKNSFEEIASRLNLSSPQHAQQLLKNGLEKIGRAYIKQLTEK